jgi:hypothetical protein
MPSSVGVRTDTLGNSLRRPARLTRWAGLR